MEHMKKKQGVIVFDLTVCNSDPLTFDLVTATASWPSRVDGRLLNCDANKALSVM